MSSATDNGRNRSDDSTTGVSPSREVELEAEVDSVPAVGGQRGQVGPDEPATPVQVTQPGGERVAEAVPVDGGTVHAVSDVDLSVRSGEIVAIVGESGSGKTVTAMSSRQLRQVRNPPSGCPFRTRCWKAQDICAREKPALIDRIAVGHPSAWHLPVVSGRSQTEIPSA